MILIWTFLSFVSFAQMPSTKVEEKLNLDSGITTIQLLGLESRIDANIIDSNMFYRMAEQKDKTLLQNKDYLEKRNSFLKTKDSLRTQIRSDLSKLIEKRFSKKELELLNTLLKYEVYSRIKTIVNSKEFQKTIDTPFEQTNIIIGKFKTKSASK